MPQQLIEVTPEASGWNVMLGSQRRGVFAESAAAVAYARDLSDELGRKGESCRIRVRFAAPSPSLVEG